MTPRQTTAAIQAAARDLATRKVALYRRLIADKRADHALEIQQLEQQLASWEVDAEQSPHSRDP